jgi:hypothetical protein
VGELLYDELVDIRFIHDSCVVYAFFEYDAILHGVELEYYEFLTQVIIPERTIG